FLVAHGGCHFGGGQADDGQAHHHGFDHRQAHAGVADGVEEVAVARHEAGQFQVGDFPQAASGFRIHADQVQGDVMAGVFKDIRPQAAATLFQVVDDDDAFGVYALVLHSGWNDDAVVDDAGGRDAAVPHQGVEWRDMH